MRSTISIPAAHAYDSSEPMPDRPQGGMDINDAIYHTVHSFPGGTAALAARTGIPLETLRQKANPNNPQHNFHPRQLLDLMYFSGDVRVLHAMAEHLGYTVLRATPSQAQGSMLAAATHAQAEFADFMRAAADPVVRIEAGQGSATPTPNELRRVQYHAQEAHAAIDQVVATMRANQRPEPKGD